MRRRLAVALIVFVGVLGLQAGPALAQTATCTVATDGAEYEPGDTVLVTGVAPADSSATVQVTGPTSASLGTVNTESDGSFATSWDGAGAVTGSPYTVQAQFSDGTTCTSAAFTFVEPEPPPPPPPPPPGEEPPEQPPDEHCECPSGDPGGGGVAGVTTGGAAGDLPLTGAPTMLIGALGVLLLAAGVVLTRRRKE
jgi:LPXTG-motif cell wall-anchored protein